MVQYGGIQMNAKLRLMLWRSTQTNKGFAMPVTMGVGLILLLLGTTMMVRSQDDRQSAFAKQASAQSLSAAEIGVTRIQQLINQNRPIAEFPACVNWEDGPDGILGTEDDVCGDTKENKENSWYNVKNSPKLKPRLSNICEPNGIDPSEKIKAFATRKWEPIESQDAGSGSQGEYRLVDYVYEPGVDSSGVGRLTVEGRVNSDQVSESTARVVATIPVDQKPDPAPEEPLPALQLGQGTVSKMGNDRVNGNIAVTGCGAFPTGSGQPTSANLVNPLPTDKKVLEKLTPEQLQNYNRLLVRRSMPTTPPLPPKEYLNEISTSDIWETLPRDTDKADSDGYYNYVVDNLEKKGGSSMTIKNNEKVNIFVRGDIELSGSPSLNGGGKATQVRIYGNTYDSITQKSKYGCPSEASGASCKTAKVHFNGNGDIRALIVAPDAVGSVNGGGNPNVANFQGAFFIKDWNASSMSPHVKVEARGTFGDLLPSNSQTTKTVIDGLSSWRTEAVKN